MNNNYEHILKRTGIRSVMVFMIIAIVVTLIPLSGIGSNAFAGSKKIKTPAKVTGLKLSVKKDNVSLKWKKAKNAKYYRVKVFAKRKGKWDWITISEKVKKTSYKFSVKYYEESNYYVYVKGYNKKKGGKWSKKVYFKVNRGKAKAKKAKNKTSKNSGTKSNNSNKNTNKPKSTPTKPKEVTIDPNYICNTEAEFYAIVKREIEKRSDDFIVYAGNGLDVTKLDGPNNLAPNIGGFNTELISQYLSYGENIDGTKDEVQYKGKTYIKTIIGVFYKPYEEEDLAEYNKMVKLVKETEGTDVDKIVAFQEYLLNNYQYDHDYKKKLHHSVIYMLHDKVAICQQYSELATYVLNDAGIPCMCLDSFKNNHAWNVIEVNGEWYNCDFTWNALFDCVYTQGGAVSTIKIEREISQKRLSGKVNFAKNIIDLSGYRCFDKVHRVLMKNAWGVNKPKEQAAA